MISILLTSVAGFQDSTVNSIRQQYLLTISDGTEVDYAQSQGSGDCFEVEISGSFHKGAGSKGLMAIPRNIASHVEMVI